MIAGETSLAVPWLRLWASLGWLPAQVTKLPQQCEKNKKHVFLRDDSAATLSKHPGLFLTKLGTCENNIIGTFLTKLHILCLLTCAVCYYIN